jgi:hypothetical protein
MERPPRRYKLVPLGDEDPPAGAPRKVRRFALARVAVSPRSALGVDRHERLEEVARRERDGDRP